MDINEKAKNLVDIYRQEDYGCPLKNWSEIAKAWAVILGIEVTPQEAVLCMIAMKLVRESKNHKEDNLTDAIGYINILDRMYQ